MTGTRTVRTGLVSLLALVAIGAGLLWWLRNHPELTQTSPVQPNPPAEAERRAPADSAGKPASQSITAATEALKDLGGQLGASKPAPSEPGPKFDIARIEPNGDSVIAGRAAPKATVELLLNGEVHDKTVADSTGAFAFVPKPLPPGKFDLKLRATEPGGKQMVSENSVAVELHSSTQEKPVAALAPKAPAVVSPQKPAVAPEAPAAALPRPATQTETNIRVDLVEAQDGGKLSVSGRSTPGSTVRLYLNDAYIATGTASKEGQVSFFIGGGLKPGEYRIRLDQLGASDRVMSRAEMPFSTAATLAASASATPASPSSSTPQASVAATQPQLAPAASAPASPTVTADARPSAQTEAERSASPPVVTETKPAGAPKAATGAPPRAGEPAATSPAATTEKPLRPERATTPELAASAQPGPAIQPGQVTTPRETATSPSSSTRSPGSSEPATKDSRPVAAKADHPDATKASQPEAKAKPETAAPPTSVAANDRRDAVVVIPSIDTKEVIRGDNLWRISRTTYGHGIRYTVIYSANRSQIRDPDLIYPGQIFVLPKAGP